MAFLQPVWDWVPGDSLGDKLQIVSMTAGMAIAATAGIFALYRRLR